MKILNFISIVYLSLLLVGCSTVDPKKFEDFESSVKNLNASLENALFEVQKKSRDHSIQKFASSPLSKTSDLTISLNGYDWSMDRPPLYLTLIKTNQQLMEMNNVFESYIELLTQLSAASLTKEELVNSAKDLNKSSNKIAQTASIGGSEQVFNILSSATVGLLQNYIDHKKAKYLDEAIKKNQSSVEEFSKLQIGLIQILLKNLKQTYDEKFFVLGKPFPKSTNKVLISSQLFDLNESLIASLEFYKGLENVYKSLPVLHQKLTSKKAGPNFKSKVDSLIKSTIRILDIQKNASKKEVKDESR